MNTNALVYTLSPKNSKEKEPSIKFWCCTRYSALGRSSVQDAPHVDYEKRRLSNRTPKRGLEITPLSAFFATEWTQGISQITSLSFNFLLCEIRDKRTNSRISLFFRSRFWGSKSHCEKKEAVLNS